MLKDTLRIGIPKGSLEESTLALFRQIGLDFSGSSRSLWLASNDSEITPVLLRPQEIPGYVQSGRLDAGLAGADWIAERNAGSHVVELAELQYSKRTSRPIRWVVAVPESTEIYSLEDLRKVCRERAANEEDHFTIATELTSLTELWLARNGIDANVEFSWGATEAKPGYVTDAIVDATETGSSLRANRLRIVEGGEVFVSTTRFFANRNVVRAQNWKTDRLKGMAALLLAAMHATDTVYLNVLSEQRLNFDGIVGNRTRLLRSEQPADPASRHYAILSLSRDDLSRVFTEVINRGGEDVWVSPATIDHAGTRFDARTEGQC